MRIALLTDAWQPQVNGVVTALTALVAELEAAGHDVLVIHPGLFVTVACPTYREIRLAAAPLPGVARRLQRFVPDAVHIATEGSVGLAGWIYCHLRRWRFTTSFHTRFPEYLNARWPFISVRLGYRVLARFHGRGVRTMVSTPPLAGFLRDQGFSRLALWRRGVDTRQFRPVAPVALALPGPVFAYFGRVAPEKNVEAFLDLDLPGSKLVIGDGPAREPLEKRYPDVHFVGMRLGDDLIRHLCAADCMVFPSRTDTLGLVLMEAMACGLPVAAYPVTGPQQVVQQGITGVLDHDLRAAALAALELDPAPGIAHARTNGWAESAAEFAAQLAPARRPGLRFPAKAIEVTS
ncbi:glycosyltransferase family 4 protein [Salinisphaera aquimarina]|uniref:Glycosyltransferase family 4 protein n=1 Tax=Salinisphaera aquimarina TaxID=2094031 RepID=A0ABV7ETK3_9GAMM